LCLQILHYAIKYENEHQMIQKLFEEFSAEIKVTLDSHQAGNLLNLPEFYPQSLCFRVIDFILRNKNYKDTVEKRAILD